MTNSSQVCVLKYILLSPKCHHVTDLIVCRAPGLVERRSGRFSKGLRRTYSWRKGPRSIGSSRAAHIIPTRVYKHKTREAEAYYHSYPHLRYKTREPEAYCTSFLPASANTKQESLRLTAHHSYPRLQTQNKRA